jgi:hypothetical protein
MEGEPPSQFAPLKSSADPTAAAAAAANASDATAAEVSALADALLEVVSAWSDERWQCVGGELLATTQPKWDCDACGFRSNVAAHCFMCSTRKRAALPPPSIPFAAASLAKVLRQPKVRVPVPANVRRDEWREAARGAAAAVPRGHARSRGGASGSIIDEDDTLQLQLSLDAFFRVHDQRRVPDAQLIAHLFQGRAEVSRP